MARGGDAPIDPNMQAPLDAWFVARAGESEGPYTWHELQSAARDGILQPRDWVWHEGMAGWIRVEEQEGLLIRPPPIPDDDGPESDPEEPSEAAVVMASLDLHPLPGGAEGVKEDGTWRPPVGPKMNSVLETTRFFLAAAGVSKKVRKRRQRRGWAVALVGLAAVVGLSQFVSFMPSLPDLGLISKSESDSDEGDGSVSAAERLRRSEACRLTGDCRRPKRAARTGRRPSSAPPKAYLTDDPNADTSTRRGDLEPETVDIGAMMTEGAKQTLISPERQVKLDVRKGTAEASLSEAQTAQVKRKVTPALKQCKGVFAAITVVVRVETDKRGRVKKASAPSGPSSVRRCLERRARYWRFGKTLASRALELTVPAKKGVVRVAAVE